MLSRRFALLSPVLALALPGCGSASGEPATIVNSAVTVSGKVLLPGGQPLANGWVVFHAKDAPGNDASAPTEADGSFKLGTFKKDDGAIPGRYVVTIETQSKAKKPESRIPRTFQSMESSPLKLEITASGPNELAPFRLR